VLPCLHAEPAVDGSCSTSDGSCSNKQVLEQQAFIQTNKMHLQKGNNLDKAASDELHDATLSGPESSYLPEDLAALQTASLLQQLEVVLSEDEASATISFMAGGQSYKYEMGAESCYSQNANISVWTKNGWEYVHPGTPRTFRSQQKDGYAKARISADGSVSGLFEHQDGQVIDVRPLRPESTHDPAYSLLAEHQGGGHAHLFEYVGMLDLESNPYVSFVHKPFELENAEQAAAFNPDHGSAEPPAVPQENWQGTRWFPGCYTGDEDQHITEIGYVVPYNVFSGGVSTDTPTFELAKAKWEEYLQKGSFIYEKQMNMKIVLSEVKVDQEGSASWSPSCSEGDVKTQLSKTQAALKKSELTQQDAAAWYAFTNCGKTWGTMGTSYIGALCYFKGGYNVASGKYFHAGAWKTFAHELGHNFKAKHSFVEGKGKTGGIMDYGDGKKDGHYQFNTKYRKKEMCGMINSKLGSCNDHIRPSE